MTNHRSLRWPKPARAAFFETLSKTGNVSAASAAAGKPRGAAYRLRAADADFAASWETALDTATDFLEAEARRRAVDGVSHPVVRAGKIVTDEEGQPVTVRQYSDRLLELLLRAHRPERFQGRSGRSGATPASFTLETIDAEIARLEAELAEPSRQDGFDGKFDEA